MGSIIQSVASGDLYLAKARRGAQTSFWRPTQTLVHAPAVNDETLLARLFLNREHSYPLFAGVAKTKHSTVFQ